MVLIKWGPFGKLFNFSKQFRCTVNLAIDMYEDDNNLIVEVNIPETNPEQDFCLNQKTTISIGKNCCFGIFF
jgi:hypothetical protein